MIALNNYGEQPFGNRRSMSIADVAENIELAKRYLAQLDANSEVAG
ncbi:MAG: hypothetical protein SF187_29890 [Deltaproteobacteria bacterium]|nr:hypothetical protein [Deltaproteobacteria bacterium]